MIIDLTTFFLLVLATYRLASDFAGEYGPFGAYKTVRQTVRAWISADASRRNIALTDSSWYWLYDGIGCGVCLSFWLSFLLNLIPAIAHGAPVFGYILVSLATAGATSAYLNFMDKS